MSIHELEKNPCCVTTFRCEIFAHIKCNIYGTLRACLHSFIHTHTHTYSCENEEEEKKERHARDEGQNTSKQQHK